MRLILIVVFISSLSIGDVYAQKRKNKPVSFQKHYNEVLPKAPQYKMSGWFFAPGTTYMMTPFIYQNRTYDETRTQKYDARTRGLGRPGIYAEIGRYKMLQYWRFFKFMGYGVSYKGLRGSEKANGQLVSIPSEAPLSELEQTQGNFDFHYAECFVNFNHIWRISKYNFIQHSWGANAGYAFMANQGGTTISPVGNENPGRIAAQLHYKLGFGIKMRGDWLIIPALETPILNAWPFENGRSSYGFFASRYRPVIFSIRFMFMRPANTLDCNPVRTREGLKMPTDMYKQNQMDGVK